LRSPSGSKRSRARKRITLRVSRRASNQFADDPDQRCKRHYGKTPSSR
jgi:hypothetical protein